MKTTILFSFLIFYQSSFSQTFITCTVQDAVSKQPLSFCAVAVKGSDRGTIANEDGKFRLLLNSISDTLLISSIGYKQKEVYATALFKNPFIELDPVNYDLKEVVVHGNDQYLYDLVEQCRKKIMSSAKHESKVYFQMQTEILHSPAEIMECYYNATASGHALHQLSLKNGRIGLAETGDHGFFLSENTAHVLPLMDLVNENDDLPGIPFQMSERKLKKIYDISIDYVLAGENTVHIHFTPKSDRGKYFRGEAWIDKQTLDLFRIDLSVDSATVHPFIPVWHEDALKNVSLSFSETFSRKENSVFPEHISFSYSLSYHANMAYRANEMKSVGAMADTTERVQTIQTSGSLAFYDFENTFHLPHYSYDENATDYRKILSFPFNADFWNHAPRLLYTDKQEASMEFFNSNGVLINFNPNATMNKVSQVAGQFFKGVNITWSDTSRISLLRDGLEAVLRNDSLSTSLSFRIDKYHLETQIFLDINMEGDSVTHFSSSVFDVNKSFYNLPAELYTDCFLNIYFDLTEVSRRKMELALDAISYSTAQMDSVYNSTVNDLKQQQELFVKETESGMNVKGISKWNEYIAGMLGIDNMKILGLK